MTKNKIVYRLATRKDRLSLHEVNRLSLPVVYTESDWADIIAYKYTYIVTINSVIIGYCAGDKTGCIVSVAILNDYRNQGYGRKLLSYAVNEIKKTIKAKKLILRVKVNNLIAQRLYTSMGFAISETLTNYYGGNEDAYLMELIIN